VRVPLLVRTPGAVAGRRVGTPLQNHRLFATALALAGIAPADDAIARPLEDAPDAIVLEVRRSAANVLLFGPFFDRDLRALLEPPYKWIGSSRGDVELYRLDRDEAELVDLAAAEPDRARALADRLEQISRARPPRFDADARAELTPQTEEALRALGYLD
jgi:arylsulfatase A-like enzyme